MAKKKNESMLSGKKMKTLKKDLDKKLAKVKPRPKTVPKVKAKVTRSQTKAENPSARIKNIRTKIKEDLADDFEEEYLYDKVSELKKKRQQNLIQPQVSNPPYIVNPSNPNQIIPNPALVVQSQKQQSLIEKLPAEDLKNITPEQIENLKELEIIRQNPGLAYLKDEKKNQLQTNPVDDGLKIARAIKELQPQPPNQDFVSKLIDKALNQEQPQVQSPQEKIEEIKMYKNAFGNNNQQNNFQVDFLKEIVKDALQDKKQLVEQRIKELEAQANSDPADQLRYMKETIDLVKETGMGGFGNEDLEKKMAMEQHELNIWKQKREIEKQDKMEALEEKKSTEVVETIKEVANNALEKIFGFFGNTIGNQMGSQIAPMGNQMGNQMQDLSFQNSQLQNPPQLQSYEPVLPQNQISYPQPQYQPLQQGISNDEEPPNVVKKKLGFRIQNWEGKT
jgi:hypothetical protein